MFAIPLAKEKIDSLNALVLAFVGDAVHTLYVRRRLCAASDGKAGLLHKEAKKYVSARGQAAAYDNIIRGLSYEEADVCRRARNHHNKTTAKHTDLAVYKKATAFEALIGRHYLSGNEERLNELLEISMK